MAEIPRWQETESKVHTPGLWIIFLIGSLFLAVGVGGMLAGGGLVRGAPDWILSIGAGIFALLGGIALVIGTKSVFWPTSVRHAVVDAFPDVPSEPVLREGSVVHRRLTHELVQVTQGWQFRPQQKLWHDDKRFLLGFGIPYLTIFSALLSWLIHRDANALGWSASIVYGILITLLCGGTCFLLIGMLNRASYRRLCWLNIPQNGKDLELDASEEIASDQPDLTAAFKWAFLGDTNRYQLKIPKESIKAVQLCPWKFVMGSSNEKSTTWAVQGLLVLQSSSEDNTYSRLPLLLISDFSGAAGLMQQLASMLDVPYLFHADAAGWNEEDTRARQRQPIRSGGML